MRAAAVRRRARRRSAVRSAPRQRGTPGIYDAAVHALVQDGWHTFRLQIAHDYLNTRPTKGGWDLTVSRPATRRTDPGLMFLAARDTTCG